MCRAMCPVYIQLPTYMIARDMVWLLVITFCFLSEESAQIYKILVKKID